MIFIPDIIAKIVDSIREQGSYNSVTDNGNNTFTINVANTLSKDEWIEIDGVEYKVFDVTNSSFSVRSNTAIPSNSEYKSLEPYYLYGHRLDLNNRLILKSKDLNRKSQKYPLIALRLPVEQIVALDDFEEVSLNIAILGFTDKNYKSEDRYENVIKPILYPLYERFLAALSQSSYISGLGTPPHRRIDRLFWGTPEKEGNVKYIFDDPLDAIELVDLKIKVQDLNC